MLSDFAIAAAVDRGEIAFTDPDTGAPIRLDDRQLQPVSVDLRLGDVGPGWSSQSQGGDGPLTWRLQPGRFVLASTLEVVTLSSAVAGVVAGKSSVARRGLQVEAAGLVDPGFSGQLTLELIHFGDRAIELERGERICQIFFDWVDGLVMRPYGHPELGSSYMHQRGPTPAPAARTSPHVRSVP
jgi:deoxycytidine triphosphate deaminase